MKYFKQLILLSIFILNNILALDIPINSTQKGSISEWLFMGPIEPDSDAYDLIGKIEKDPLIYFRTEPKNPVSSKIQHVKSDLLYGGQFYYQLYDKIDKGDVIFAFSYLESKNDQTVVFINNSARGSLEVFLNGRLIKTVNNQLEDYEVKLKKGLNNVLVKINPDSYRPEFENLFHRFFFRVLPDTRFEITGKLLDINGKVLTNKNVTAFDNVRFYKDDTTWYDLSGNGNHGTLTNGPTHTIPLAAHPTKGITLDGSDDWISNTSLDGGDTSFTIELWVYHNGTDQNASYGIYSGGRDQGPLIYHHGSGMGTGHYFPSSPGGDYPGGNSASAVNGDWTQIVHNYYNTHSSSSNLYKSYKNGVHVGSSTIDFHDSGHGRGTDGYALGSYSTGNNVYKGSYGIFKYYNRNLSDAEVMQNFNSERNRFGK